MAVISPDRWRQVEELFQAALPLHPRARNALLDRECAGDEALRREVESLLAADDRAADDFLQSDVATLGMQALADGETGRTEMALLATGTTLDDRYKILAELDAGGMGEVYKAQDLKLSNRLVVVKVLKKTSQNIPWIAKKFLRDEGEAQARVQHPNVANVLDKGRLPSGEHYLAVEFIPGATLRKVLDACENRQMDFPEVAQIIRQVGRAVTAIHNARLIHRDLKPENLMVQDEPNTDELLVKVIDFGIVRVLDKSTVVGQIAGTLHYLAPEQLNGQDVTPASDVYALGVIAHEMLTGRRPFNPENLAHLLKLQQEGVKVQPTALRPGLPPAAEEVMLRALSYEPANRQQSAREFGDQLAQALTVPTPPRQTLPPPVTAKRRPIVVAAVALAALVLIAVIPGLLWWKLSDRSLPSTEVAAARLESQPASGASPANPRRYDVEAGFPTGPPPPGTVYATIGFTVWRTRPATTRDGEDAARETIDSQELAAERIADTIADGDRLYLGIESLTGEFLPDKGGYLYVINREQYADGTFGRARLIFPTLLTYAGQNRVKPGQPIVLPETNRPFIIKRSISSQRPPQVAETYTIILSPWEFRLPEPLSNKAMVLPDNLVANWEKQYGGRMNRATLRDGIGKTMTKREQVVGSRTTQDTAEPLTPDEPMPQTCFKGKVKISDPALVTVELRFKN